MPKQPKWISSEEFKELKDKDGYVRYCWSFGCMGKTYAFSPENEDLKRSIHNWIVFDEKDEKCEELFPNIVLVEKDRESRRFELKKYINDTDKFRTIELERLDRSQQLQRLKLMENLGRLKLMENLGRLKLMENLGRLKLMENLGRLKLTTGSYEDYEYQEGDVVYCDIPYEDTASYSVEKEGTFDQEKFFQWAISRPYPVYISSLFKYSHAKDLYLVWGKDISSTLSKISNSTEQCEVLFCTKKPDETFGYYKQMSLFD